MIVALAMLVDAYRQLNARKLFWITLFISASVVLGYASVGFDEDGMSMLFGLIDVDSEVVTKGSPMARMLYRGIFSFLVSAWLAWVATVLALISTTSIFPDFVAGGAIDLVLCKPIRRVTLFLLKYLSSLLFVVLQVSVLSVGIFLCMGWRIGEWSWTTFAAIPLVTLFFSYLYCVNVLVGVITRSALPALLLTLLFWVSVFALNTTDGIFLQVRSQMEVHADEEPAARADDPSTRAMARLKKWHRGVLAIKTILPKTSETIGLLDRWLKEDTDVNLIDLLSGNVILDEQGRPVPKDNSLERRAQMRMVEEVESRSLWYVVGTSVLFELVVLGVACIIFVRRDY